MQEWTDDEGEELDEDVHQPLHELDCDEEIRWWDALTPYGETDYDGTRFYD